MSISRFLLSLLTLALFACGEDAGTVPGVMLSIRLPEKVEGSVVALRVRASSGAAGEELEVRGDRTVDVDEWPAEVFLRATDTKRAWSAYIQAVDGKDRVLADGLVESEFKAKLVTVHVTLLLVAPEDDVVDAGKDAGSHVDAIVNVAASDAGVEAGADGSRGSTCTGTEIAANSAECERCTCQQCGDPAASCYASVNRERNAECAAIMTCAVANRCTGDVCYCGSSLQCSSPDGVCRAPIELAEETSDVIEVMRQGNNANAAWGRAKALLACQLQRCEAACGL